MLSVVLRLCGLSRSRVPHRCQQCVLEQGQRRLLRRSLHTILACGVPHIRVRSNSSGKRTGSATVAPSGGTVFALQQLNMDSLFKYALIALLVVTSIVLLSVCADGLGLACAHVCCTGANRSRPIQRHARKLRIVLRSAFAWALLLFAGQPRGCALQRTSVFLVPTLLKVSALRI
jgi:hypothetical protein